LLLKADDASAAILFPSVEFGESGQGRDDGGLLRLT